MQFIAIYRETGSAAGPFANEHDAVAHAIAIDLLWGEEPEAWEGWDEGWDLNDLGHQLGRAAVLSDIGEAGWTITELLSPEDSLTGAREAASANMLDTMDEAPDAWLDSAIEDANESAFDGGEL